MLVVVSDAMGARDEANGDDARGKLGRRNRPVARV